MNRSRLLGTVCAFLFQSKLLSYATLLVLACMSSLAMAQTYTFTDLPTLGGTINQAFAINNSGLIAGTSWTTGDTSSHATVWINNIPTDLAPGVSGWSSVAEGINNSGLIAGHSVGSGFGDGATVWDGTVLTILDTLPGTVHSDAWDINDVGQVVGRSIIDSSHHATLWNGTTPTDLGANSFAYAINNSGQVVGSLNETGPQGGIGTHATIWNGTTATDLGTLGGSNSEAQDINNFASFEI